MARRHWQILGGADTLVPSQIEGTWPKTRTYLGISLYRRGLIRKSPGLIADIILTDTTRGPRYTLEVYKKSEIRNYAWGLYDEAEAQHAHDPWQAYNAAMRIFDGEKSRIL